MTSEADLHRSLVAAFRMPSAQTMVSRKSSITNAFVNAVIPIHPPKTAEIAEALAVLGMSPQDVRCAYCGDKATEWDHLRPLVRNRRPTGFVSEIANLVPACGKCNQSKGNKHWKGWMQSSAKLSPTGRGVPDTAIRIEALERFERWRPPVQVDFVSILGEEEWENYWSLCENVIEDLRKSNEVAIALRTKVTESLKSRLS